MMVVCAQYIHMYAIYTYVCNVYISMRVVVQCAQSIYMTVICAQCINYV